MTTKTKKAAAPVLRESILNVRMTEAEYDELRHAAANDQKTIAAYSRAILLAAARAGWRATTEYKITRNPTG